MTSPHHPLRTHATLALAVVGVLTLGACATDPVTGAAEPTGAASTTTGSAPTDTETDAGAAADAPAADVQVTVDDGNGTTTVYSLTCDPAGGDHPDPEAACAALTETNVEELAPVDKDQVCTTVYGGPQTALIIGTLRGEPVNASFARTNGCEIDRWDALAPVFGPVEGVDS